jgi:hypothetical protein
VEHSGPTGAGIGTTGADGIGPVVGAATMPVVVVTGAVVEVVTGFAVVDVELPAGPLELVVGTFRRLPAVNSVAPCSRRSAYEAPATNTAATITATPRRPSQPALGRAGSSPAGGNSVDSFTLPSSAHVDHMPPSS